MFRRKRSWWVFRRVSSGETHDTVSSHFVRRLGVPGINPSAASLARDSVESDRPTSVPSAIRRWPRTPAFFLIACGLWGWSIAWGEQVPANEGLGWDGVRFARYATEGPRALLDREINRYYVQRVGPSLLVHAMIRVAGLPFDPVTIRWAFVALNVTVLSLSLAMILDLASLLGVTSQGQWVLFLGLFVNPANGRLPIYYANIGDSVAFALGTALVWAWATRRFWAQVALSLVALMSWPAAFYLLAPLIIWPRAGTGPPALSETLPSRLSMPHVAIALPLGGALLALSWMVSDMPPVAAWTAWTTLSLMTNAWFLGLASIAALVVVRPVLAKEVMGQWSMKGMLVCAALFLAGQMYVRATESGSLSFSEQTYWREVLLYVRTRALAPFAGHTAYFGALAAMACAIWPRALAAARSLGPGPLVALSLIGLQALDTESRRLNANWFLAALCTVLAIQASLVSSRALIAFASLAVVFSKLWWRWSGPNLFAEANPPGNYYNLQGPSLSDEAYLIHLAAASVLAAAVWVWTRRVPPVEPAL